MTSIHDRRERNPYKIHKVKQDGAPHKREVAMERTRVEAETRMAYLQTLNPSSRFVIVPDAKAREAEDAVAAMMCKDTTEGWDGRPDGPDADDLDMDECTACGAFVERGELYMPNDTCDACTPPDPIADAANFRDDGY